MGIWQNLIIDSQKDSILFDGKSIVAISSVVTNLDTKGKLGLLSVPHSSSFIFPPDFSGNKYNIALAVDGRINNKKDLCRKLQIEEEYAFGRVIIELYKRYGRDSFYSLDGAFSLILYDMQKQMTYLFRSFPSGLPLYYTNKNNLLTVSTNPVYLLHRPDVTGDLRQEQIIALFALDPILSSRTVYEDINEVVPGEIVTILSSGVKIEKPTHNIYKKYNYNSEADIITTYRQLLENMMKKSILPHLKYGIMLSSGMDSSTLAYFASKQLQEENRKLQAFSWTFPHFKNVDETQQVIALSKKLGIDLTLIDAENYAPFDNLDNLPLHPESPSSNIFWSMISQVYAKASEDDVEILLNGHFGDDQYPSTQNILMDTIKDHRYKLFFPIVLSAIRQHGFTGVLKKSPEIRAFIKENLPLKRYKKSRKIAPEWLNNNKKEIYESVLEKKKADNERKGDIFSSVMKKQNWNSGVDRYFTNPYNIERLEPYRDFELLNFTLGIPTYMVYRNGEMKYFAREAMQGLLPDFILKQSKVGVLCQFAHKSFMKNKDSIRQKIFDDQEIWPYYIDKKWMEKKFKKSADIKGKDILIIWQSLNIGPWQRAIKPGGDLYEGRLLKR